MKRIAYIIPGYGESTTFKEYQKIAQYFNQAEIEPIGVKIKWGRKTPRKFDDFNQDFLKQYKKHPGAKTCILGFSNGAMIAYLTAQKTKPDALILCSLSPYFIQDYNSIPPAWLKKFKRNYHDSEYDFNDYAKKAPKKTILFVGSDEDRGCIFRAKDAKKKIKGSKLKIIPRTKHKISAKSYLQAIEKVIKSL